MANKRKPAGRRTKRRRTNPMYRRLAGPSRPRTSFDGVNYEGISVVASPATVANLAAFPRFLDCANAEAFLGATDITQYYSEYKFINARVHWEPSVGPASSEAGARIHMAVFHNPEQMVTWRAATNVNQLAYIRGAKTYRTWNAWERVSFPVEMFYRKKWYDVNETIDHSQVDENDRSSQSMVAFVIESVGAIANSHGTFRLTGTVALKTLSLTLVT